MRTDKIDPAIAVTAELRRVLATIPKADARRALARHLSEAWPELTALEADTLATQLLLKGR